MIFIDGYNLIHASAELSSLASDGMETARDELVRRLDEYAAARDTEVHVVFDGAGRAGATETEARSGFLYVTFTGTGTTADAFIERACFQGRAADMRGSTVVTADYDQQRVISGAGMLRMTPKEFLEEMRQTGEEAARGLEERSRGLGRVRLGNRIPAEVREGLLRIRNRHRD